MAWGSVDTITARIGQHLQAGADHVALTMLGNDGLHPVQDPARQLARNLLRRCPQR